jgi:hypothetical protein
MRVEQRKERIVAMTKASGPARFLKKRKGHWSPAEEKLHYSIVRCCFLLLDANDSACETSTGIARGQGQFVPSLAKVIHELMHDDGTSDDAVLSDQAQPRIGSRRRRPLHLAMRTAISDVHRIAPDAGIRQSTPHICIPPIATSIFQF